MTNINNTSWSTKYEYVLIYYHIIKSVVTKSLCSCPLFDEHMLCDKG